MRCNFLLFFLMCGLAPSMDGAIAAEIDSAAGGEDIVLSASHRKSELQTGIVGVDNLGSVSERGFPIKDTSKLGSGERRRRTDGLVLKPDRSSPLGNVVPECGTSPLGPDRVKLLVDETARFYKVDPEFAVAIAWTESRFDQFRNSKKGARGPMQLLPETASRFRVKDICDPRDNIEGGVKYLRFLFQQFENPLFVAAAYNAGEGRVLEYGGIPPFKETVDYVSKVLNYQISISHPAHNKNFLQLSRKGQIRATDGQETGIIAVRKNGTFVGGVMHF